ncbi:hypothetical protein PHB09_170 [Pseudomonas phage PHB09]|uniref:Uncharacterized protein n=1 Tax=Pseudomonas phage PHB09 TaxID=2867265 RepID=A0AAE8XCH3_9CAUD|nr:hypothetical protein QGX10_gp169 [Pseudomonas phage PHB09]UAV84665.1 hypothetical protein PHB09_170 [Pseudomonas phage PHB09]
MDLFFEALVDVLKEFLAGAVTCIVVMLAIVLVVSSMLYSIWLFLTLFFLIVLGIAVLAKMEEIKRWRYK